MRSLGVPQEKKRKKEKRNKKIHPMLQLSKEGHVQDKCLKLKKGMEKEGAPPKINENAFKGHLG